MVSNIFYFHPEPWGNDPIWRAYFSNGLVQPPTRYVGGCQNPVWVNKNQLKGIRPPTPALSTVKLRVFGLTKRFCGLLSTLLFEIVYRQYSYRWCYIIYYSYIYIYTYYICICRYDIIYILSRYFLRDFSLGWWIRIWWKMVTLVGIRL